MNQRPLKSRADRLILECVDELVAPRVLVVLLHGTTLASGLRELRPDLQFCFWTPEQFFQRTLAQFHDGPEAATGPGCAPVSIECSADLPDREFDSIAFPTHAGDSSEQAQEVMQSAHQQLRMNGRLIVSTNNAKDHWVQSQMKALFPQVEVRRFPHGVVCIGTKTTSLKRARGFRCRFGFRHGDRVLMCESRPGVFSHRRLDGGAKALIKSLALVADTAPMSIVEMGSGCGAVSIAAAASFPSAVILAVDSDARAVESTAATANLNAITTVQTLLSSNGEVPKPGTWDLLLGNPPYYSDFRIAELFLQTAKRSLRPGGRVHIVSKPTEWHEARMKQLFHAVTLHAFGDYTVFCGVQR